VPSSDNEPPPWQRLAPITDLVTPMAVRVAATLRLADLMHAGVSRLEELAERTEADADALGRLLRHLTHHGVFAEPSPGRFTINETADLLRSDHPSGVFRWLDLKEFGGRMDLAFTGLMHTVRTGRPAWETVFGAPFWDYLAADAAFAASFDEMMAGSVRNTAATGYDWSGVRHVIDVGGGTGSLLAEVLHGHADIRGTLVDLPDTVVRGRRLLAEQGLDGRCDFAGQSFFDPLPPGGDVYVLSGVLHDWNDEQATAILRRCAEAAGDNGRVVIIEHSPSGKDPRAIAEMDLRMLVLCGGRERSVEEYAPLAAAAGLALAEARTTPSDQLIITYRPA
jgi:SAM-dependent methyltransferase